MILNTEQEVLKAINECSKIYYWLSLAEFNIVLKKEDAKKLLISEMSGTIDSKGYDIDWVRDNKKLFVNVTRKINEDSVCNHDRWAPGAA